MLHSICGVIRYCFRKTCAGLVTFAAKMASVLTNIGNSVMSMLADGAAWLTKKFENVPVKKMCVNACLRQVILLVGGFVCCFLFSEEARGDLTWFEKVLKSSMDWASILANETKNKLVGYFMPSTSLEHDVT